MKEKIIEHVIKGRDDIALLIINKIICKKIKKIH